MVVRLGFFVFLWTLFTPSGGAVYTFASNTTVQVGSIQYTTAEGQLQWDQHYASRFAVVPALVSQLEANALVNQLTDVELDQDPDSVDGEPTFEFYLEHAGPSRSRWQPF